MKIAIISYVIAGVMFHLICRYAVSYKSDVKKFDQAKIGTHAFLIFAWPVCILSMIYMIITGDRGD